MSNVVRGNIYEVQKFGVTIEWDKKIGVAESAFKSADPGGVVMYRLDASTSKKYFVKQR